MSQVLQFGKRGQSIMSINEEVGMTNDRFNMQQSHQYSSNLNRPGSSRRSTNGGSFFSSTNTTQTPPRPSIGSFSPSAAMGANPTSMMSSPSLSSAAEGYFGRESRADSIGTLWSSADVPLMFDGHRGSGGDRSSIVGSTSNHMQTSFGMRSNSGMNFPRGVSFTTAITTTTSSSSQQTLHATQTFSDLAISSPKSDKDGQSNIIPNSNSSEPSELLLSDDGQEFIAVRTTPKSTKSNTSRPSTAKTHADSSITNSSAFPTGWTVSQEDVVESNIALLQKPGSRPGSSAGPSQKKRPTPLHLAEASFMNNIHASSRQHSTSSEVPTPLAHDRMRNAIDAPVSVSHTSQMTLKGGRSKSNLKGSELGQTYDQNRKPAKSSPGAFTPKQNSQKSNAGDLYKHAERFFDSSYSMAPSTPGSATGTTLALATPDMARLSRFSDDSHATYDDTASSIGPLESNGNGSNGRGGLSSGRSHASHSSAESSNTPEIIEQIANAATAHLLRSGLTTEARNATLTNNQSYAKNGLDEEQPMTPLRVAMSLASPSSPRLIEHQNIMESYVHPNMQANGRRPSTTDAAIPSAPKSVQRPNNVRHAHTSSDQELLRRLQAEANRKVRSEAGGVSTIPIPKKLPDDKLAFLHTPSEAPIPPSPKRGALFGLRIRAVSTPKLRQSRGGSQDGSVTNANEKEWRPTSSNRPQHPPQAPSGRFRSQANASAGVTAERCDSVGSAGSYQPNPVLTTGLTMHRFSTAESDEGSSNAHQQQQQPRSRRPSSVEALAAAARRLRRPSRNGSNTSLTAPLTTTFGSSSTVDVTRQRLGSSASSQMYADLHHVSSNASLRPNSRKAKASSTSLGNASRPKTKSGWSSHLSQGLTLHIEQGSKKFSCRMNYQYYDPFGRPESLCTSHSHVATDEIHQSNRSRSSISAATGDKSSRNGSVSGGMSHDDHQDEQAMGILEFVPESSSSSSNGSSIEAQPSPTRMAFVISDSKDAVTLKHLTIGDDTKADLITKQADLSLRNVGTHEVSGSERKGKVSWRFEFAVEEVKRYDETWDHASTPKMDGKPFNEVIEGIKLLRPIRFACSTTLLDPSRARKSRVFNMIRKQIGPHIESHSLAGPEDSSIDHALNPMLNIESPPYTAQSFPSTSSHQTSPQHTRRTETPLSPRSLPRSRQGSTHNLRRGEIPQFDYAQASPNRPAFQNIIPSSPCQTRSPLHAASSIGSSAGLVSDEGHLIAMRNASVVSAASSGAGSTLWSPTGRPGLVPFKGRRTIATDPSKQMYGRTSISEQGGQGMTLGSTQALQNIQASPLTIGSSLETSFTSIDGSPSPGKNVRELSLANSHNNTPQPINKKHYQQQSYPSKRAPPSTALGLETNSLQKQRNENRDDYIYEDSCRQWASSQSRTRNRIIRAATAEGTSSQSIDRTEGNSIPVRPPTASEEIKMAYLNSTAAAANRTKPRSRHGGNGSGHGHSHSVIQAPSAFAAASTMEVNPPRRLTSASIHQHQQTMDNHSPSLSPNVNHQPKQLPPTPPSGRMKRNFLVSAVNSDAARVISGSHGNYKKASSTEKSFEPPEGPYWM